MKKYLKAYQQEFSKNRFEISIFAFTGTMAAVTAMFLGNEGIAVVSAISFGCSSLYVARAAYRAARTAKYVVVYY